MTFLGDGIWDVGYGMWDVIYKFQIKPKNNFVIYVFIFKNKYSALTKISNGGYVLFCVKDNNCK